MPGPEAAQPLDQFELLLPLGRLTTDAGQKRLFFAHEILLLWPDILPMGQDTWPRIVTAPLPEVTHALKQAGAEVAVLTRTPASVCRRKSAGRGR
jgi:hypothetical protein